MWVLKERRYLQSCCGRRKDDAGGEARGCIFYAEEFMTRVMGYERWYHNDPMDIISLQGALKDAS